MSTCFIIGNGFDLNLGLKTSYSDFIKSHLVQSSMGGNDLLARLHEIHELQQWIDIEHFLAEYSNQGRLEDTLRDYKHAKELLVKYLKSISFDLNLNSAASEMIKQHYIPGDSVFNFNYTKSFSSVLTALGKENQDGYIRHVHGSLSDQIIFGVDDKSPVNKSCSFLYKTYYENFNCSEIINSLNNANKIVIFGHSLGSSDHMYFRDVFQKMCQIASGKLMCVYHYGEIGKIDMVKQIQELTSNDLFKIKRNNRLEFYDSSIDKSP